MNFTTQDVETMIAEQRRFYFTGVTRTAAYRIAMLSKLKEAIILNEETISEALHKDLRKSPFESHLTEIGIVLSSISHMIKNLEQWMEPEIVKTPMHLQPAKSFVVREPYGSVLIIGPFNYPFQLVMEPLIGSIAGGNCAIVKPSEAAVHTGEITKKILTELFPSEFVRVVEGEQKETSALIHASFDFIFFTGSVAVGKVVMKAAAERLTPITLELGGKSPALVDQTADIARAAERIVWGKFVNNGQTCVAPDYVLVHHSVKDKLVKAMSAAILEFYGKVAAESVDYGRIVNDRHFSRLLKILEKDHAHVVYGGDFDREDLYIEPTLLDNVTWNSASMEDEIFGPLLPILTYENLGEAVHHIRQLPKPLAAYMFTENEQASQYFIDNLPFGGGCINDTITHFANGNLPFGGVGPSGMNAYHGKYSFEAFTHAKAMMKKSTALPMKIAFPPYGQKLKLVKPLIR
ncbi:aldehyde dehydrogenase [Sporosarcina sp. YIM B06819]|uniref:aldehyde dehydrogenase n=1 Tax=Sporosarcina sp. YIM B06819 TaxID=3081769 RepID=UPI00298C6A28|nr:aldehyde dehydrogenase [Sporosarcina sp. YIM B06819]